MEDSGIDSGDKEVKIQPKYINDDSEDSSNEAEEVIFRGISTSSSYTHVKTNAPIPEKRDTSLVNVNSCRVLQRKLEQKVERAKRSYKQLQQRDGNYGEPEVCVKQPKSSNLIPISRLQFPGCEDNQTLIEYKEAGDEDNDEDEDEGKFFRNNKLKKTNLKLDLSDTFSIQEMTIESDSEGSGGSETLELLAPTDYKFWEKVTNFLCCGSRHSRN